MTDKDVMKRYLLTMGANMYIYQAYCDADTKKRRHEIADFTLQIGEALHDTGRPVSGMPHKRRLELAMEIVNELLQTGDNA